MEIEQKEMALEKGQVVSGVGLVYLMREVDSSLVDGETTEQVLKDLDSRKLRLLKFRKVGDEKTFELPNDNLWVNQRQLMSQR